MNELQLVIVALLAGVFIYQNKKSKDAQERARRAEVEKQFMDLNTQAQQVSNKIKSEASVVEDIKKQTEEKTKEQLSDESLKDFFDNR